MLKELHRAGVILSANEDRLEVDAPAGATTPALLTMLKARKPELLAVLNGAYLNAGLSLLLSVADPQQREGLAELFDERAGICQHDGNKSRGEAERLAYEELTREVESFERQGRQELTSKCGDPENPSVPRDQT